jgi:3-oxoadipate enol-lactonase
VDDHADDLLALARALGLDRFVLAGLSMGGYVAMAVARRAPERIRGLMLCDTRAEADTDQARANRVAMRARLVDGGPPAVAADMLPKLLGETTARTQPELIETVRGLIELNGAPGIDDAIVALMTRPDSTATLAGLGCPALILAGDEDVLTPVALHERMHELIPGSTLEIIPGAGHLSNLERPDAFNARLARFLARVERDV